MMNPTVANWVASQFSKQEVERVFVYPGGTITPLINACLAEGIAIECFKTEQGAGYAALAHARLSGKPQVLMVTSGPGVTNAITPLADAFYDSTPLILITGQIGTADLKIRRGVRQRGFQETPTVEITRPLSKRSVCLLSAEAAFTEIPEAFRLTVAGRFGPCVIDFPMDIQRREIGEAEVSSPRAALVAKAAGVELDPTVIAEIAQVGAKARRPLLLLGQGVLMSGTYLACAAIADKIDALVVTSFLGVGAFNNQDARCLGYVGHTGHLAANRAVSGCDFLLVLGSRLDVRQTGTRVDQFVPEGVVAWVDIDAEELANPRVPVRWKVESDIALFCETFLAALPSKSAAIDPVWREKLLSLKRQDIEDAPPEQSPLLQPRSVLRYLGGLMADRKTIVVTGVGCHQHWAARHLPFQPEIHRYLSSAGHGAMGYDLPTALGAAMACPEYTVLCVVGDGSLLMNIQEFATLRERRLDVKILVLNNSRLGMVSQFQLITWGTDPTTGDVPTHDFSAIARGFDIEAERLDRPSDIPEKLCWLWSRQGPALLDARIDPAADVIPMLLVGQTMAEMWMGRKA